MLLEFDDVYKSFGPVEVLMGVSLHVGAGEVVGLVGDNGAGKSTLMKSVMGIHRPDRGRLTFDGRDIGSLPPGDRRRLGLEMIYQDLALAPQQSVSANIFLGREPLTRKWGFIPYAVDKALMERQAGEMIERLGARIPSVKAQVGSLSGGQQQSVAIARSLTFEPKLVIMDEPTAALAVREVEHVLELIETLKNQDIAVILISHRLNDIFAVCERICVLRHGKIAASLNKEETSMNEVVSHIVGADEEDGNGSDQ